jgi:hypothetical protein
MFDILDSLLATASVVLGISLIVQAVQQIFKQSLDLKSAYMRDELLSLFNTTGKVGTIFANFRRTSKLAQQADDTAKRIVTELEEKAAGFGFKDLHLLENIDAKEMKEIIGSLPVARDETVRERVQEALKDFDRWFDLSKKAYQEHYERRMKYWSFVISLLIVVALNANLFDIYRDFSASKSLRDIAVTMGERLVSAPRDSVIIKSDTTKSAQAKADTMIAADMKKNAEHITTLVSEQSFQIMGWTEVRMEKYAKLSFFTCVIHFLLGWLGMTLLVSLGAPFWYDILKAIMGFKDSFKKNTA